MGRKRKLNETMTRDIRNITRGQCQACGDCDGFISVNARVLCDYCGCPPAHHESLGCKKPKSDPDLGLEILDLNGQKEGQVRSYLVRPCPLWAGSQRCT